MDVHVFGRETFRRKSFLGHGKRPYVRMWAKSIDLVILNNPVEESKDLCQFRVPRESDDEKHAIPISESIRKSGYLIADVRG